MWAPARRCLPCVGAGLLVAPLLCGLAVVRVASWCPAPAVEPLVGYRGYLFDGVGRPGSRDLFFGRCFQVLLRDFFLLGTIWFEPASGGRGSLYYPLLSGCGLFVGARRGRLSFGSLRLDDVSRKNCI